MRRTPPRLGVWASETLLARSRIAISATTDLGTMRHLRGRSVVPADSRSRSGGCQETRGRRSSPEGAAHRRGRDPGLLEPGGPRDAVPDDAHRDEPGGGLERLTARVGELERAFFDEAGRDEEAPRVHDLLGAGPGEPRRERGDTAVRDANVPPGVEPLGRIDD